MGIKGKSFKVNRWRNYNSNTYTEHQNTDGNWFFLHSLGRSVFCPLLNFKPPFNMKNKSTLFNALLSTKTQAYFSFENMHHRFIFIGFLIFKKVTHILLYFFYGCLKFLGISKKLVHSIFEFHRSLWYKILFNINIFKKIGFISRE